MKRYPLLWPLINLLIVDMLCAQGFFMRLVPTTPNGVDARQISLGFCSPGTQSRASAIPINPALASIERGRLQVTTSWGLTGWSERRTYPILDSFGDYLADNTYVANASLYPVGNLGLLIKPITSLTLGLDLVTGYQAEFSYEEEVRGSVTGQYNRDPLVGYHRLQLEEKIQQLSLGAVYKWRSLRLGVGWSFQPEIENRERWEIEVIKPDVRLAADTTTTYEAKTRTASHFKTLLGGAWQVNPRLLLTFAWHTPYNIEIERPTLIMVSDPSQALPQLKLNSTKTVRAIKQHHPANYQLSLTYTPVNIIPTKFIIEADYRPWSRFKQEVSFRAGAYVAGSDSALYANPIEMKDVVQWKIGVEHNLFSGLDLRVGFCNDPNPLSSDLNRVWFTAGIGSQFGQLAIDCGAAVATSEYKYPDLFIIPSEQRLSYDTVHEFWWLCKLSLHYAL